MELICGYCGINRPIYKTYVTETPVCHRCAHTRFSGTGLLHEHYPHHKKNHCYVNYNKEELLKHLKEYPDSTYTWKIIWDKRDLFEMMEDYHANHVKETGFVPDSGSPYWNWDFFIKMIDAGGNWMWER